MVQKTANSEKSNRRDFLRMVAFGSAYVFSRPLEIFSKQNISFSVENMTGKEVSEEIIHQIGNKTAPYVDGIVNRLYPQYGVPLKITQTLDDFFKNNEFLDSREEGYRFIRISKECIADALAFWESGLLKEPNVIYNVPLNADELAKDKQAAFTEDNRTIINIVKSRGTKYKTKVVLEYKKRIPMINNHKEYIKFDFVLPTPGEFERTFQVISMVNGRRLNIIRKPIYWSVGENARKNDAFSFYETPPHEILHHQMSGWTNKYMMEGFKLGNRSEDEILDEVTKLHEEFGRYEEILVDAICTAWTIQYSKKKGLNLEPFYRSPETKNLVPKVNELTPQKLIEIYVNKGPRYFYNNIVKGK